MKCRICGGPLEQADGPGRPKTYCGTACRRSAEMEIRRIDRRLADLEGRLSDCRATDLHTYASPRHLRAEIARQGGRLAELLSYGQAD